MPNREILEMLLLVYAAPAVILTIAWKAIQRHAEARPGARVMRLTAPLAGLYFLFGYFCLERQWPWEFFPITRSAQWYPVGLAVTVLASPLLDAHPKMLRRGSLTALTALSTWCFFLLLHPYIDQLDADRWSLFVHRALFAGFLIAAMASPFALMRVCRQGSTRFAMVLAGALFAAAGYYLFYGAASAKVAQWMALGGTFAATLVLASLGSNASLATAGLGWCLAFALNAALLYGLYASSQPMLLPVACVLVAPWGAFLHSSPHGRLWIALWAAIALGACLYLTAHGKREARAPGGDGYDEIYGYVSELRPVHTDALPKRW